MSGLVTLLQNEMDHRGWSLRELAGRADIPPSTISKIMNNPEQVPSLRTLASLGFALELPLSRLISACGYDVDSFGNPEDVQRQIEAIAKAVPELRAMFLDLARSDDDVRRSVLAYMRLLDQERQAS